MMIPFVLCCHTNRKCDSRRHTEEKIGWKEVLFSLDATLSNKVADHSKNLVHKAGGNPGKSLKMSYWNNPDTGK